MDVLASLVAVALLVGLLIWTRRRWRQPRLYMPGIVALWIVAVLLALIILSPARR